MPQSSDRPDKTVQVGQPTTNDTLQRSVGRRKRLRLTCLECRKKKLSCDRTLPCRRCVRTGRPEQCIFEADQAKPLSSAQNISRQESQGTVDEIRDLQGQVAELRALLLEQQTGHCRPGNLRHPISERVIPPNTCDQDIRDLGSLDQLQELPLPTVSLLSGAHAAGHYLAAGDKKDVSDPRERLPRGFYSQNALFQFFSEIPNLFPFVKKTYSEHLKPLGIQLHKNNVKEYSLISNLQRSRGAVLESLLPPKTDVDVLLSFYIDHLEHLHRVIHVKTFEREYKGFWGTESHHHSSMTSLILAICSVSSCTLSSSDASASIIAKYHTSPSKWVPAVEDWLAEQRPKHRKLVHFQILCLISLAKRANMIGKKRSWEETGSLVQAAIIAGLHRETPLPSNNAYTGEIRRRVWHVIRELDLQSSFENGLPTILHSVNPDIVSPSNLDDEAFDETSTELSKARADSQYTRTSYQYHSARTWSLRLGIAQRLFSPGNSGRLSSDDTLTYTHQITKAIDELPTWQTEANESFSDRKTATLPAFVFLRLQLLECILALHRPFLAREGASFSFSANVCYCTSRDILALNTRLADVGFQSLALLRSDVFLGALNLVHITIMQPKSTYGLIITSAPSTFEILDSCLAFMEDRYLRCSTCEPWCLLIMSAAIALLRIHLGKESPQTARQQCASRFLEMYHKDVDRGSGPALPQHDALLPGRHVEQTSSTAAGHYPDLCVLEYLDTSIDELGFDPFDFDIDREAGWGSWPDISMPTQC
ncbi:hypothetical protein F5Y15DRAFT_369703 [Xylariaceae sp. FL0016]|nr:hypothetical protein F5Y15DRAFT_369703 [Xylariaceae sp. FL0016]